MEIIGYMTEKGYKDIDENTIYTFPEDIDFVKFTLYKDEGKPEWYPFDTGKAIKIKMTVHVERVE